MTNHAFNPLQSADGTPMDAYIAFPDSDGPFPGLMVFQEAYGVNNHIRNVAERFCAAGYAVIAPDLFHRTAPRFEAAYTDFPSAAPHLSALTPEGLSADVQASFDWLRQTAQVGNGPIGCVGYCLGGRVSFLANANLPLQAAVSYYGGGIDAIAARAQDLHAPQLFFWGGKDTHITPEKINTTLDALKAAGKDFTTVTISSADHGFNCDERAAYNPHASREAWAHTLAFLDGRLMAEL